MQWIESANSFGRWLVAHLGLLSIELALLAGVVAGVLYVLRIESPVVRHLFWLLVLVKPTVGFLIASPLSFYALLSPLPPIVEEWAVIDEVPAAAQTMHFAVPPMSPVPMPDRMELDRYGTAGLGWLVLAATWGLRLLAGYGYVATLRRRATPHRNGPLYEALVMAAQKLGMHRRATIATSDQVQVPILTGIVHPVILFPESMGRTLSAEQVELIVLHELSHVRRVDNLTLAGQRLAEMFLFFHPAIWLCGRAMRREAERACDDAVIAVTGRAAPYADSLTRVAEARVDLKRRRLVHALAATESHFAQRVKRILAGGGSRLTLRKGMVSILALAIVGCLGLPMNPDRVQSKETRERVVEEPEEKDIILSDPPNMLILFGRDSIRVNRIAPDSIMITYNDSVRHRSLWSGSLRALLDTVRSHVQEEPLLKPERFNVLQDTLPIYPYEGPVDPVLVAEYSFPLRCRSKST